MSSLYFCFNICVWQQRCWGSSRGPVGHRRLRLGTRSGSFSRSVGYYQLTLEEDPRRPVPCRLVSPGPSPVHSPRRLRILTRVPWVVWWQTRDKEGWGGRGAWTLHSEWTRSRGGLHGGSTCGSQLIPATMAPVLTLPLGRSRCNKFTDVVLTEVRSTLTSMSFSPTGRWQTFGVYFTVKNFMSNEPKLISLKKKKFKVVGSLHIQLKKVGNLKNKFESSRVFLLIHPGP